LETDTMPIIENRCPHGIAMVDASRSPGRGVTVARFIRAV
jgi:hypothetical protein